MTEKLCNPTLQLNPDVYTGSKEELVDLDHEQVEEVKNMEKVKNGEDSLLKISLENGGEIQVGPTGELRYTHNRVPVSKDGLRSFLQEGKEYLLSVCTVDSRHNPFTPTLLLSGKYSVDNYMRISDWIDNQLGSVFGADGHRYSELSAGSVMIRFTYNKPGVRL